MPEIYLENYLPLLMQLAVAAAIGGGMVLLSALLGKHRYSRVKMGPYECGIDPIGDAQGRFSVKFYMVAMLFILFDVEAIFLIPWAVVYRELPKMGDGHSFGRFFGFWEMLVYIGFLLVGFFYVVKTGVLNWSRSGEKGDL